MKNWKQLLLVLCTASGAAFSSNASTVVAWGANDFGQTDVPANLTDAMAVAGGYQHSLALKSDGTVASWGAVPPAPDNVTNVTLVSAGWNLSLGLREDGTVVQWGFGTLPPVPVELSNAVAVAVNSVPYLVDRGCYAVRSDGTVVGWGSAGVTNRIPPGLSGTVAMAAGQYHALALKGDGIVSAWCDYLDYGYNSVPSGLSNVVAVAARVRYSLALTADGRVFNWGPSGATNVLSWVSNAVAIAAGAYHSLVLRADGTVVCWGDNSYGQTNVPANLSNVVAISCGFRHSLAVVDPVELAIARQPRPTAHLPRQPVLLSVGVVSRNPVSYQWQFNGEDIPGATEAAYRIACLDDSNEGTYRVIVSSVSGSVTSAPVRVRMAGNAVVAWGYNGYGQTNTPPGINAVAVSAGAAALALTPERRVIAWGNNVYGQTNVPSGLTNVVRMDAGLWHNLVVKTDGKVVAWGNNNYGQCSVPAGVSNVIDVAAEVYYSVALRNDGTLAGWGSSTYSIPQGVSNIVSIASGVTHCLALKSDGSVVTSGTVGLPAGLSNVVDIAAGDDFSAALKSDGTVTAWGLNNYGQCSVPTDLSNVVAISAGDYHCLALKSDGTAVAWGYNHFGQTNVPAGLSNVVGIAAGHFFNLALLGSAKVQIVRQPAPLSFLSSRTLLSVGAVSSQPVSYQWQLNGADVPGATNAVLDLVGNDPAWAGVYCVVASNELGCAVSEPARVHLPFNRVVAWGSNFYGQTNVPAPLNATAVAAGYRHSHALGFDGSVTGWGANNFGQTNVPSDVIGVIQLAACDYHTLAVRADGTVAGWGYIANIPSGLTNIRSVATGDSDSLALSQDGTVTMWNHFTLKPATTMRTPASNVVAIAAGYYHYLAAKSDGSLSAWGNNAAKQCSIPAGCIAVAAVAAGVGHSVALMANGRVVAWGDNSSGQCNVPADLTNAIAIAAGASHSLALRRDGRVTAWGPSGSIQCTVPAGLSNVIAIAAGADHSVAVTDPRDPWIVRQPVPASAFSGNPVLLTAGVRSARPLTFQWRFNGADVAGATDAWLYLPSSQTSNSGAYSVVASNELGFVVSANASVNILERPPFILTQPASQAVLGAATATLQVIADGSGPLSYQWQKDGATVAEGTGSKLTLPNLCRADGGMYSVVVSNAFGTAASAEARVHVMVPQEVAGPFLQSDGSMVLKANDSDGGLLTPADGAFFQAWTSTNLVNWELLPSAITISNGALWLQDSAATNYPARFYKIVEQP